MLQVNDTVCFTGKATRTRSDLEHLAHQAGLHITTKAAQATVVVLGAFASATSPSSVKHKTAIAKGIPVIMEAVFETQARALIRATPRGQTANPPTTPAPEPVVPSSAPVLEVLNRWNPGPSRFGCKV